jgi:hypothetical protein
MKPTALNLDLEHRTAYRFSILAAQSTRCMSDLYRKLGLTVGGWRTLSLIGRYEPIHPSSIADRTSVDPDKVTRAVDRLVDKGLVARKVDSEDRARAARFCRGRPDPSGCGRGVPERAHQGRTGALQCGAGEAGGSGAADLYRQGGLAGPCGRLVSRRTAA